MFVALDKLHRQNVKKAIVAVPEKSIGASFATTLLCQDGFFEDWFVAPKWNLCNAPGTDGGKVDAIKKFLESHDKVLVCTHATFRFAFERFDSVRPQEWFLISHPTIEEVIGRIKDGTIAKFMFDRNSATLVRR